MAKTKTKKNQCRPPQNHPFFMLPWKGKPVCRTCCIKVSGRAVHMNEHIAFHRREGHTIKLEFGWEQPNV